MADRDADKVFDEADILIIAGICLGMTQEAVGNWVCTPMFPAGVSERTVRNRLANNREAYDRLLARIGTAFKKKEEEFEELTREKYKEKLAALRSKGVRVKEIALDQAINNPYHPDFLKLGVNVADSLEDRDLGKPSQVHKHEGDVRMLHQWNPQPVRQLAAQEVDMVNSRKLLEALPDDVLEGELVDAS